MNRLGEIILQYRQDNDDMSQRELARRCGLSNVYIKNLEKGADPKTGKPYDPTVTTLRALAKGMNISLESLLEKLGVEVVNIDGIDEMQRATVMNMISYFRQQKRGE
jgi:transcriptional regulator with XRE-family HTH domain